MLSDKEKLKDCRNMLGLTQINFAKALGVAPATISMVECGKNKISLELKALIKQRFSYDIDKQTYTVLNDTEHQPTVPIPLYEVYAAANPAGGIAMWETTSDKSLWFDVRWLKNYLGVDNSKCSILYAKGNSMDSGQNKVDDIKDGDLLLIDHSQKNIINNKTYLIEDTINNELLVKKVVKDLTGKVTLISNNPNYQVRKLTSADNMLIIGRVVWNGSKDLF